ncbi:MAG: nitrate transporter, permease protein [Pseudomonadota bacterium]|jgi:nitrate/nitrite transport system permease protein
MVSAVFHPGVMAGVVAAGAPAEAGPVPGSKPLAASTAGTSPEVAPAPVDPAIALKAKAERAIESARARRVWLRKALMTVLPPLVGFGLLLLVWELLTLKSNSFPGPGATWASAVELFADPFYSKGPNDQGIGWNILFSLRRVAVGFGLAAAVGIPLGFALGRSEFLNRMFSPLISLLRPVSPLAWLPIGLLVFKSANPAAIWTIFICSIWPMVINTAVGVQRVPQDYLNVARVLALSEWKVITRILLPSVLPYMLTGVRLSVGTAWLVIVAAEMLTGGVGIGFWVWDEWNNLNVRHILIAIFVIGIVGLLLEQMLVALARRFSFDNGQSA